MCILILVKNKSDQIYFLNHDNQNLANNKKNFFKQIILNLILFYWNIIYLNIILKIIKWNILLNFRYVIKGRVKCVICTLFKTWDDFKSCSKKNISYVTWIFNIFYLNINVWK